MSENRIPPSRELENEHLRWARAFSWAIGQSCGPWVQGVEEPEAERITALARRIREVQEASGDYDPERVAYLMHANEDPAAEEAEMWEWLDFMLDEEEEA